MGTIPKSKKGGVVTSTVMGVGGLIIAVIIILVITSTILGGGMFDDDTRQSTICLNYTTEEKMNISGGSQAFCNSTFPGVQCAITQVVWWNNTDVYIEAANYTQDNCRITMIDGDTEVNNTYWNISATVTYAGELEAAGYDMESNFTEGIDNISEKIPTILLIIAVVFLFGALVLLIRQSNLMGVGGSSSL